LVPLSLEATDEWPEGVAALSPWERLAAHLVREGADPWLKDEDGLDALDWAFSAGSRSVLALLVTHPGRPTMESIYQRADGHPGRKVPWLHGAVYRGHLAMFNDLVRAGWPPESQDNQKWFALSWANRVSDVQALLPLFPALSFEQKEALKQSWVRRNAMKLVPAQVSLGELLTAFDTFFPLDEKTQNSSRELQMLTNLLVLKPGGNSVGSIKSLVGETEEKQAAYFENHWGLVATGIGAARGEWSGPSAAFWGALRSNFREVTGLGKAFLTVAQKKPSALWLETPIRSADKKGQGGVVQGGLVWFAIASAGSYSDGNLMGRLKALEEAWKIPDARRRGFEQALSFTSTFVPANASSDWQAQMGWGWGNIISSVFTHGKMLKWEADGWRVLLGMNVKIYAESWKDISTRAVSTLQKKTVASLDDPDLRWSTTWWTPPAKPSSGILRCPIMIVHASAAPVLSCLPPCGTSMKGRLNSCRGLAKSGSVKTNMLFFTKSMLGLQNKKGCQRHRLGQP